MAVMTFTRRQVTDMLPEFLTRRQATFGAKSKAFAAEAGVSLNALTYLSSVPALCDGDVVPRSIYAFRAPYPTKRPLMDQAWAELVSAGLATPVDTGWRVSPRALELGNEMNRRLRAHVRELPFPAEPTRRAAGLLWPIAQRVPAGAGRAAIARRLRPEAGEPTPDPITLTRAAQVLWGFRDDCHIPAWEAAGYEGPAFDVLSFLWKGPGDVSYTKLPAVESLDALEKAMGARQGRADLEKNVDALAKRGDVAREGDAVRITPQGQKRRDEIEAETDRRYYAVWDLDDAGFARLGDDLRQIIDALPKE